MPAASSATAPPVPVRVYSRKKILLVLMIGLAMSLIQVSSVNVALSSLAQSLGASPSDLQWVLSGYALAIGIVLVPAGRLGDVFGRSRLFLVGIVAFTVASALCGLMTDPLTLNLMRVVQGLSAGIFSPQTTGIIQQYFAGQSRARAFSLFGLVVSVSVALGPVLSGLLIEGVGHQDGWRATFMINVPLGIVGIIAAMFWLPFDDDRAARARRRKVVDVRKVDLDPVGMVLLVAAVLCTMLPFMTHASSWRWMLLPLALALLVGWVRWEARYEASGHEPMVPLSLFRIRSFSFSTAISALQFLGTTSVFVTAAMYLQNGLHQSAMVAGLIGVPNAIASALASLAVARHTIKHGRLIQVLCIVAIGVGLGAAVALMPAVGAGGVPFWWLMAPYALMGVGQGAWGSANQTQLMLDVPAAAGGTAGGVSQTVQRVSTAIGNAMVTAVLLGIVGSVPAPTSSVWSQAVIAAYGVIVATLLVELVLAVWFWRSSASA